MMQVDILKNQKRKKIKNLKEPSLLYQYEVFLNKNM